MSRGKGYWIMKKLYAVNIFKIIYPVLIYAAISFGISFLLKASKMTIGIEDLIFILLAEQIISLAVIVWIYRFQNKTAALITYKYGLASLGFKNTALILLSTYFMLNITGLIALVLRLNERFPTYSEMMKILSEGPLAVRLAAIAVLAPVLEEVLFRGIIFSRMREISNFHISAIISSLIWASMHMNMVQGVTAFAYGLFLAFLYEKFKVLWVPMLSHGFFNLTTTLVGLAFLSSGGKIPEAPTDTSPYLISLAFHIMLLAGLILLISKAETPRK
jgi:membrane protease YdiL (CAAX protease family)